MGTQVYSLADPYPNYAAVVPSDTVNFHATPKVGLCRALYVGVAGDVAAVGEDGVAVVFKAVPVGLLPVRVVRVNATGTTATNIVRLW